MMMKLYLQITDPFLFCLQFPKYLKKHFLSKYTVFFKKRKCFIMDNMLLERNIQQNMLL